MTSFAVFLNLPQHKNLHMSKDIYFSGQPVFTQILSLIDRNKISKIASRHGADRYYKKFKTYNHLVSMLYCSLSNCTSSREVVSGLKACQSKLYHLGINHCPGRSTLCDANKKRDAQVFKDIYEQLYRFYHHFLPDSRKRKDLYIVDSSTISLFQDIMKAAGRPARNGKSKGGVKVHTLLKADEDVASQINYTSGAAHDTPFLQQIKLEKGAIVAFDKAYVDYKLYERWTKDKVYYVTRIRKRAEYEVLKNKSLSQKESNNGVISDQVVMLGHLLHKNITRTKARLITYKAGKRTFRFLTNHQTLEGMKVAEIYKQRWQIELLFKRIKQNFPLKYFLGDNENAIKIQIWCAFIADLILKIIHVKVKRKWAFSNLTSIVRLHLMNYIALVKFLNNPDGFLKSKIALNSIGQASLFEP